MRNYQNKKYKGDDQAILSALAKTLQALERRGGNTQKSIEIAIQIDQTTISRARHGKLKRVTSKVRRLKAYADMQIERVEITDAVRRAAILFYKLGGSEQELIASIQHATTLIFHRLEGLPPDQVKANSG